MSGLLGAVPPEGRELLAGATRAAAVGGVRASFAVAAGVGIGAGLLVLALLRAGVGGRILGAGAGGDRPGDGAGGNKPGAAGVGSSRDRRTPVSP
ncbi:hypothetical protein [Micromonospora harpali]|uniref:Uncharacterized protein n=1 Tax=Micromonospora harpali TaxID=1490225 RepID=A0ABW1HNS0_9ACTN